jgi:hypothetical protein
LKRDSPPDAKGKRDSACPIKLGEEEEFTTEHTEATGKCDEV